MPHSPRWHDGRLWVCESGAGTLGVVEPQTGRYEPVADIPVSRAGSTSPVATPSSGSRRCARRAVFSGIPITERLVDRGEADVRRLRRRSPQWRGGCLLQFDGRRTGGLRRAGGPGRRFPDLINDDVALMQNSFVVPDAALSEISHAMHVPSGSPGPAPQQAGTSVHS